MVDKYRQNANALLIETRIKPPCNNADPSLETEHGASTSAQAAVNVTTIGTLSTYSKSPTTTPTLSTSSSVGSGIISSLIQHYRSQMCPVCATVQLGDKFYSLSCAHSFCKDCWSMFFETQIFQVSLLYLLYSINIKIKFYDISGNFHSNWLYGSNVQCSRA